MKIKNYFVFLFISFLFLNLFITTTKSDELNIISVDPFTQTVSTGESFTVNIFCTPAMPIKAYEFVLLFDPSLLQAESVTEGNIFSGYTTFFNSGIINNVSGSIINVYGLIIGQGNVTTPGNLATISFTATTNVGVSNITLYGAGLTNETMYLPIVTNNGNVVVENTYIFHYFSNVNPANNSVGVSISTSALSINVDDPEGDPFYWEITTSPFIGNNSGLSQSNGTIICNVSNLKYLTSYYWFVKCKDIVNGGWTNNTYLFTTKSSSVNPPGGGGAPPPAGEPSENNPPVKPLTPIGPIFIEKGILYEYLSQTYDLENDEIRYMFDWGDGTFSAWSEYLQSNTTVTMAHSWNLTSVFEIRVIAQDKNGFNSNWSEPLEIFVSDINHNGEEPNIIIDVTGDFNVSNKTFVFDASQTSIVNGVIVNYTWDFGDGEFGYGVRVVHTYKLSKEYIVNLTVVDNFGDSYTESITLNVFDESDKNVLDEGKGFKFLVFENLIIISVFASIIVVLIIVFREKISIKLLDHKINRIKKR